MDRVSDSDRNAAVKAVEAALADGRIVQADRDHRVAQVRSAQTPSELAMITQDLGYRDQSWPTYTPPETTPPETATPAEPVTPKPPAADIYGPAQTSSPEVARLFGTKPQSTSGCVIIPALVMLLVAGGIIVGVVHGIRSSGGSDSGFSIDFDEPSIAFPGIEEPPPPPKLHTVAGFDEMREAIRAETGATEVFEASIYPGYASLSVPVQPTGQRAYSYFYDGELNEPGKGRSTYERFDLAQIDPQVMIRLVQKAKRLVEDPTSWYVIIRKPGPPFDDGAWFSAYASNEFSESGYLQATLDGTVINRYVSE